MGFSSVYIDGNWRRVKMCLGCCPFENRHTGEELGKWVDKVLDKWDIRQQVGLVQIVISVRL